MKLYMTKKIERRLSSLKLNNARPVTLEEYIVLAAAHNWNLRRDINYCYYCGSIQTEEALRRVKRLYPQCRTLTETWERISRDISLSTATIKNVIYDNGEYSVTSYARILLHIMHREKEAGYPDALDFEE